MNHLPILALRMNAEQENDSETEEEEQASPVPESNQPKKLKNIDPNFDTPANPPVHKFTGTHSIQQEDQPTPAPEPASPPPSEDVVVKQLFKAEE